jgi:hypothetical protein
MDGTTLEEMPEDLYIANQANSMLVMVALNRILYEEKQKALMTAVAIKLKELGADFSKVDYEKLQNY